MEKVLNISFFKVLEDLREKNIKIQMKELQVPEKEFLIDAQKKCQMPTEFSNIPVDFLVNYNTLKMYE